MRVSRHLAVGAGLGVLAAASLSTAQPTAAPPTTVAPVVSPSADALLKAMSAHLGAAGAFTFHAEILFDHVLPTGQKVQFAAAEDVALQRPDKLYVAWSGDLGDRKFWYDGSAVTLYDPATPFYASAAAPPQMDGMLDSVEPETQFAPPLADFFYANPYGTLKGKVRYGVDLGAGDVNGKACHSLAFVEKDIDWQIWIEDGPRPTPCKLVITYKTKPAQPQFSAVFSDWKIGTAIPASTFVPNPPSTAKKISFASVTPAR